MGEKEHDPLMHTAEHILNGTMVKMFGCPRAFSTHIEKKKSKIDILFDRNLTDEEIQNLQNKVNEIITLGLNVTETYIPIQDAAKNHDLSRLPEDANGNLRIINIGDYDSCPCIGNHLNNTAEIGGIRIVSSSCEDGVLRIRFKKA